MPWSGLRMAAAPAGCGQGLSDLGWGCSNPSHVLHVRGSLFPAVRRPPGGLGQLNGGRYLRPTVDLRTRAEEDPHEATKGAGLHLCDLPRVPSGGGRVGRADTQGRVMRAGGSWRCAGMPEGLSGGRTSPGQAHDSHGHLNFP